MPIQFAALAPYIIAGLTTMSQADKESKAQKNEAIKEWYSSLTGQHGDVNKVATPNSWTSNFAQAFFTDRADKQNQEKQKQDSMYNELLRNVIKKQYGISEYAPMSKNGIES